MKFLLLKYFEFIFNFSFGFILSSILKHFQTFSHFYRFLIWIFIVVICNLIFVVSWNKIVILIFFISCRLHFFYNRFFSLAYLSPPSFLVLLLLVLALSHEKEIKKLFPHETAILLTSTSSYSILHFFRICITKDVHQLFVLS